MASFHKVFGNKFHNFVYLNHRYFCSAQTGTAKKGLVIGVYTGESQQFTLTKSAEHFNSTSSDKLGSLLQRWPLEIGQGSARILYDLSEEYFAVCLVGLGKKEIEADPLEDLDSEKERVRVAAAVGANALQNVGCRDISVEDFGDPESAAEGVTLKLWRFDEYKTKKKEATTVRLYSEDNDRTIESDWTKGVIKGEAQNVARRLAEAPANLMTPSIFANNTLELLQGIPSVEVFVREKKWIDKQNMNTFLSVAKGSSEPPIFLEINYRGSSTSDKPVVLVGKGITFDTGGINLKTGAGMVDMRGDKGGAACVLATTMAIAKLGLPINVTTLIPLCENMPSSSATKPGDVVTAMNGKTVRIDNTDAEGRLILADALSYAQNFNPLFVMDVATLTGAMSVALGNQATGVFTNSDVLYNQLRAAGTYTGDRVWRFPLWKGYSKGLTDNPSVDICNITKHRGGGACSAAAFLKEFIPPASWIHLDIAGVMSSNNEIAYLEKGMSGRPTRTIIQLLQAIKSGCD